MNHSIIEDGFDLFTPSPETEYINKENIYLRVLEEYKNNTCHLKFVFSAYAIMRNDKCFRFSEIKEQFESIIKEKSEEYELLNLPYLFARKGVSLMHIKGTMLERDGNKCLKCGATSDLTIDHILPRSKGGEDTLENIQTLCLKCNVDKGVRVIDYRRLPGRLGQCAINIAS